MRAWLMGLLLWGCSGVISGVDAGPNEVDAGHDGGMDGGMDGGPAHDAGGFDAGLSTWDGGTPAWRAGLVPWQWHELAGTSLSLLPVANPFSGQLERPPGRVDAWNGLAADRLHNRLFLAAAGGHHDWAGNEVYAIDLSADAPAWQLLRPPSPGNVISEEVDFYADGRPSSTHLYSALHFVAAHQRVFKLSAGSCWGSGNWSNSNVDAFNLATGDWDAPHTWDAGSPSGDVIDRPYAYDVTADDAYTFFRGAFRRWNAATGTWEQLAQRPSYANNDLVLASPSAFDQVRQRAVFTRNLYRDSTNGGLVLSATPGAALTDIVVQGPAAAQAREAASGAFFFTPADAVLIKTRRGGEVIRLDAQTWTATVLPTAGTPPPDSVNGVYTRWLWLPRLGGIVYLPRHSASLWFLPTE